MGLELPTQQKKFEEQYRLQERDEFSDEVTKDEDKPEIRSVPTESEKLEMDKKLIDLGKLFAGSDVRWQLDGALNISLMKGEYIGLHKDVDLTIEPADLEKLDEHLFKRGYGLFLTLRTPGKPGKRILKRMSPREVNTLPENGYVLCAVDAIGKIKPAKLSSVDVHFIQKNEAGEPTGFSKNIVLPKEWYDPQPVNFQGQEINLSHPAKVIYFKLYATRPYDMTDVMDLLKTGKVTSSDVETVSNILEEELREKENSIEKVAVQLVAFLDEGKSELEILELLKSVAGEDSFEADKEKYSEFVKKLLNGEKTVEKIVALANEVFGFQPEKMRGKIGRLREVANLLIF